MSEDDIQDLIAAIGDDRELLEGLLEQAQDAGLDDFADAIEEQLEADEDIERDAIEHEDNWYDFDDYPDLDEFIEDFDYDADYDESFWDELAEEFEYYEGDEVDFEKFS